VTSAKIADGAIAAVDVDSTTFGTTFWKANGNSGTTAGTNFLGTTDNQPLELRVNGTRALRLEPTLNDVNHSNLVNVIAGSLVNYVSNSVVGATIAGGGAAYFYDLGDTNSVTADFGTVGGGGNNTASGVFSTVGGGLNNTASGGYSTVGGGIDNTASGTESMVAGGYNNKAAGNNSFAAGQDCNVIHDNSFMFSDGSTSFSTQAADTFNVLASGGYYFYTGSGAGLKLLAGQTAWSSISDRDVKKNIQPVDYQAVLDKLARVPIRQWNYKWEKDGDTLNMGPMAQDFKHAFYPGRDDKSINTLEFDGVELAAIQGLNQKLEEQAKEKDMEIKDLKKRLEALERIVLNQKSD
jgi:hypothetical protein